MIIRNNFDNKRALPNNDDYQKVGKGYNNTKKENDKKNINPFFKIEEEDDKYEDDEEIRDKWDFFK